MAEYKIPAANWTDALAGVLRIADLGDVVIVRTEPMLRLAESAAERMGKGYLTIRVSGDAAKEQQS